MFKKVDVDYGSLSNVLKNQTRKKIILELSNAKCTSYLELMNLVEVSHTGKFNYHLKVLAT